MERERTIIGSLVLLQLVLWLGFLVHRSPRFPGSFSGGVLALSGALLMVVPPVLYSAAKRIDFFKRIVTKRKSLGTILTWHVYTSGVGSILAILHTGHRFESNLGIALTAVMLLTVLSGFIGRYFLAYSSMELREKRELLDKLVFEYNRIIGEVSRRPNSEVAYVATHGVIRTTLGSFLGADLFSSKDREPLTHRAVRLAESISDVEYAIKTHELLKRRTSRWLTMHIATSIGFYAMLVLHVSSAIYFGLRWFD